MSGLTQQRFLGASIRSWTTNVGWNNQVSQFTVSLVEDTVAGDVFVPPTVGFPEYFRYTCENNFIFEFGGIVINWQESNSSEGKRLYTVTLNSPQQVMEGVPLIIGAYNGITHSVPNLINPYGYLEDSSVGGGFGEAGINEGGMPWNKIINAANVLIGASPSIAPQYGSPLNFRSHIYRLDLTELPPAPPFYRIQGNSIGLMDSITQLCEEAGYDYFVRMTETNLGNVIKFKTVSRAVQPPLGQIFAFIGDGTNCVSNVRGEELRNEITSAFIIGDNINALWLASAPSSGNTGTVADNMIWPFWGVDASGIPILGRNTNVTNGPENFQTNEHKFTLDSRTVLVVGVGDAYNTDVGEMRAAIAGESQWASYVVSNDPTKAIAIGLVPDFKAVQNLVAKINAGTVLPSDFNNTTIKDQQGNTRKSLIALENWRRLHKYVQSYASNYYGKKFMVRIPFVSVRNEDDTNRLVLSHEPTDGAFVDDNGTPVKTQPLGVPDFYEDLFQLEDGRFSAFVRYDNAADLDLTNLSPDSYIVDSNRLFLKCQVEREVYFMNNQTFENPRVVITLPNIISKRLSNPNASDFISPEQGGTLFTLTNSLRQAAGNNTAVPNNTQITALQDGLSRLGGGYPNYGFERMAVMPDYAAVPLKSNILTYGPWWVIGPPGRTHFEQDTSLVPWNYNGFDLMNRAAQDKIRNLVTLTQVVELGNVEVPGLPSIQLGDLLKAGGPNVTGIDVQVGEQGVTTTYTFRTYSPKFGTFSRYNNERVNRLVKTNQEFKRNMKSLYRALGFKRNFRNSL